MLGIPAAPLALGLGGLLPFVWGVVTMLSPGLAEATAGVLGPRFVGPYVQVIYGGVILCFMSGALWGFAAKPNGGGWAAGYGLSVIPALWAFFAVAGGPAAAAVSLAVGFLGILWIDRLFWRRGLAPPWWMRLRLMLTGGVVLCLLPAIFG